MMITHRETSKSFAASSNADGAQRQTSGRRLGFVKAYMHNGVFKSLEEVVHFYNKRNIAVNLQGASVAFDLRDRAPGGVYPVCLPPPEVLDNVQNVAGLSPANAGGEVATNGQVGNLGLSADDEAAVVAFLETLTDGYRDPTVKRAGPAN